MRRRAVIAGSLAGAGIGGRARAQQAVGPVIGFLRTSRAAPFAHIVAAFRLGLNDEDFVEGRNVTVEYRWADDQLDRMPGLADELVRRPVAVIVANGLAAEAARAVTAGIPIVFVIADDPVRRGLVASLGRPGGNVTGITFFGGGELGAKRLELLHELAPAATVVAVLIDPTTPGSVAELPEVEAAARTLGLRIVVVRAASESEFEPAFAAMVGAGAGGLIVSGSPLFTGRSRLLVALAARHAIPAIYDVRDHTVAGGLISYAASFTHAYRQAGAYAGRILKGAKPVDLPVLQPTTFELVLNLATARALGLTVPPALIARADEVLE